MTWDFNLVVDFFFLLFFTCAFVFWRTLLWPSPPLKVCIETLSTCDNVQYVCLDFISTQIKSVSVEQTLSADSVIQQRVSVEFKSHSSMETKNSQDIPELQSYSSFHKQRYCLKHTSSHEWRWAYYLDMIMMFTWHLSCTILCCNC